MEGLVKKGEEEIIGVEDTTVKEQMLQEGERIRYNVVRIISGGDVVRDEVVNGERIIVTSTPYGFGYQVFESERDTIPCYYALGSTYLSDLSKSDDIRGVALRYGSRKSMIQRNMEGFFVEYITDPNFRALYMSYNNPAGADLVMSQHMAGYNPQDAVTVFGYHFRNRQVLLPCAAQMLVSPNAPDNLRLMVADVGDDGSIDYDPIWSFALDADRYNNLSGVINGVRVTSDSPGSMGEERLREVVRDAAILSQSTFLPIYNSVGAPTFDEAQYNGLLEGFKGFAPTTALLLGESVQSAKKPK